VGSILITGKLKTTLGRKHKRRASLLIWIRVWKKFFEIWDCLHNLLRYFTYYRFIWKLVDGLHFACKFISRL